jgi:uncharacterized protein (TIGR02246 family)
MVQELYDRERIKELKARYWRAYDTRDWETFRSLFTDDCRFDVPGVEPIEGADAFLEFVKQTVSERSVHHGHQCEITFESPTEAQVIWVMHDYLEYAPDPETGERRGLKGYGHYYERYVKADGAWRIGDWRLAYLRVDPLPREPLPETILGGPELLRESQLDQA